MTAPAPVGTRWHTHHHRVWPSTGGSTASVVARLGDWTWQAVERAYGVDVLDARTAEGTPAYLSFHYCRYRATPGFHLRSPTFGDHLAVASLVVGAGPQSALTLHRLRRGAAPPDLEPAAFRDPLPDGELRVEHLNRWITPTSGSNQDVAPTAPVGFDPAAAPPVPDGLSPRGRIRRARTAGSFRPAAAAAPPVALRYAVDAARDLNAVGLMYFAAYSGVVDWALWRAWRAWRRDDASFLRRVVLDQELLYQGNADPGTELDITVRRRDPTGAEARETHGPGEIVDVVVTRGPERAPLCVCTLTLRPAEATRP